MIVIRGKRMMNTKKTLACPILLLVWSIFFPVPNAGASPDDSLQVLKQEAEAGNPRAQDRLAHLYMRGLGVPNELKKAVFWYQKAATNGNLDAQRNLGWLFWRGKGVSKDPLRAKKWLVKAALSGDAKAMNLLGVLFLSDKDPRDLGRGVTWLKKGARAGNRESMFNLGSLYDRGLGVPLDYSQAARWWKKAASRGDTAAETGLGDLYEKGLGVPRDYGKASYWEEKAASAGNPLAREAVRVGPWSPVVSGTGGERRAPPLPRPEKALNRKKKRVVPVAKNVTGVLSSDPSSELALLRKEIDRLESRQIQKPSEKLLPVSADHPAYHLLPRKEDYAVVVGVETYPGGIPQAPFADRDARSVYRHLVALGVPPDHIRLLFDGLATRGGIDASLRWLSKNVTKRSTVYFYYSGHGVPGAKGESDLAPFGVLPEDLADTAYPLSRLVKRLSRSGAAQTLVILDACFSGAGPRSLLLSRRPVFVRREAPAVSSVIVLAASGPDQESRVFPAKRHGLLTYYLLRGLNGRASRDGHLTVDSLYRYVRSRVSGEAHLLNGEQTPRLETGNERLLSMMIR